MGIFDILPHLPGGKMANTRISLRLDELSRQDAVPLDGAGPLWQFANAHSSDYLRGNYRPALVEWARLLNYLRSILHYNLYVCMDGRHNPHKKYEEMRRQKKADSARELGQVRGQIRNTPEYIAHAVAVCKFLKIEVVVSAYEADSQVMHRAIPDSLIAITGDSDLLAIGPSKMPDGYTPPKIMIVSSWHGQLNRVIDLDAPHTNGELPLHDLYVEHGRIVFQLYAACRGCDFTELKSGIPGIGYSTFIQLLQEMEDEPSPTSLANSIWREYQKQAKEAGLNTEQDVTEYLQRIVDIYSLGAVYDEKRKIIDFRGSIVQMVNDQLELHANGKVNSRTAEPFSDTVTTALGGMDYSHLLNKTAADVSTIRGVNLPSDVTINQNSVPVLRDFVAARGGSISGINKPELVKKASLYQLMEKQVSRHYIDRHTDTNGSTYVSVDTSTKIPIGVILANLNQKFISVNDLPDVKTLIADTHRLFLNGEFDTGYDNIARVAPELPADFIYKTFAHIGSSVEQKNIGDALKRCFETKQTTYHGLAFDPEQSTRCILLCKAVASMNRDEKTRKKTDDGEPPEKMEYMLIMELFFEPTSHITNKHDLGVFTRFGCSYCTACVAGQGNCRHRPERLWHQYHHWTEDRYGIERPSTLDSCSWAPGGRALVSDVRAPICSQQCVILEKSLEMQDMKQTRGVKRNCTEGNSTDYTIYYSREKVKPNPHRFTPERFEPLFTLIETQNVSKDKDVGRPCRAAVRWFGKSDVGLDDVRGDVELWGLKDEVEKFQQMSASEEYKDKKTEEIGELVLAANLPFEKRKDLYRTYHAREYDGDF